MGTDPSRQAMAPIGLLADVLGDRPAVLAGQVDQQLELLWSGQAQAWEQRRQRVGTAA